MQEQSINELINKYNKLCFYVYDEVLGSSVISKTVRTFLSGRLLLNNRYLVETFGPFIYNNAKEIKEGNLKKFVEYEYKEQLVNWEQVLGADLSKSLRDALKSNLKARLDEKYDELKSVTQSILQKYADIVIYDKTHNPAA